ncbi:MAG: putative transport protein HsrA [Desulfovibrio sp.]
MTRYNDTIDRKLILSILATGVMSFAGVLIETAMNVTFPTLMTEFGIGTSLVQWITTGYLLVLAIIIPASSFLKRRFTSKSLFIAATSFFLAGTLLCAAAPTFCLLLFGRIIQGIGTGIALPLMFNIVLEQVPINKLGFMMGVASLITAVAPAVGPSLGGLIAHAFGWRMIFIALIPFLLAAFIMGIVSIRQVKPTENIPFEFTGYVLVAISFTCFIFGTSMASTCGWVSLQVIGLLSISIAAIILFYRRCEKLASPLLRVQVFHNTGFVVSMLVLVLLQLTILALGFLIPNYAQIVSGENPFVAGCLLLPGCLVGAILAPVGGKIFDLFGAKKPIMLGNVFMVAATALFALLAHKTTPLLLMLMHLCFSIGLGFTIGNTITNGLRQLPADVTTDGNAVVNTLQQLAGAIGTSVAASIVASAQVGAIDTFAKATMRGSQHAFILLFVFSVAAFALSWLVFQTIKRHTVPG